MSDQGKTYTAFIESELKAERDRRTAFDGRGQSLVTTSGALVTLLGGLAALVRTPAAVRLPTPASTAVGVALVLFVGAAACGIVAGWNRLYAVVTVPTLHRMTTGHWKDDEVDARNNVATVQLKTLDTLRRANRFKARWVGIGLIAQASALLVLAVAVTIVISSYWT
ncbi:MULTISPECIES: hypothetical protein [Saccharothrix]|uniref:hypothetical protein n=1 Tax=Saccharothrix TaxID=2071 RepID=UPI00093E0396|nr:hypothetical protein [Saccharothrix sp. CB00851]OKI26382.1 hypothetical protein A6A25_32370 [Saccharothrix sp. CB00851]